MSFAPERGPDVLDSIPSRTALGAALYRAAHQLVDRPLVFEDPFALRILGPPCPLQPELEQRGTQAASAMRAFIAARSRYAEDAFAAAHARGVCQYVMLGAGLDTFAYRCTLERVRVYEMDRAEMHEWKREWLGRVGIAVPQSAASAPVDFERETVGEALSRTSFDFSEPAFFAWLGVTAYLTAEAVRNTLQDIAKSMAPGSEIVFDFATPLDRDSPASAAREAFSARVEAAGEPLRSVFAPEDLCAQMRALGFSRAEVVDAAVLNRRYFLGRRNGLQLRGGHLMHART